MCGRTAQCTADRQQKFEALAGYLAHKTEAMRQKHLTHTEKLGTEVEWRAVSVSQSVCLYHCGIGQPGLLQELIYFDELKVLDPRHKFGRQVVRGATGGLRWCGCGVIWVRYGG